MNYEKDNNRGKPQPNHCGIHKENSIWGGVLINTNA